MLLGAGALGSTVSDAGAGADVVSLGTVPSGAEVASSEVGIVEPGLAGISLPTGATSDGAGLSVVAAGASVAGAEASASTRSGAFFVQATVRAKAADAKRIFFIENSEDEKS